MNLEKLTELLKKDSNGSLSAALRAEQVFYGLITYSEALALMAGKGL
jgi:D-serine dehydratase